MPPACWRIDAIQLAASSISPQGPGLTMTSAIQSTVAKTTLRRFLVVLLAAYTALISIPALASAPFEDIDHAIRAADWAEVRRASLLWAQDIYPDASEVLAIAAASMTDEAVASARKAQPWQRAFFLLAAAEGSDFPVSRKLEIVHAAFEAARSDAIRPSVRVEGLVEVALAYLRLGANVQAHQAFKEALSNAKNGLQDHTYGVLVDTLVSPAGTTNAPLWMLDELNASIRDLPPAEDVRSRRALAAGYFSLHQPEKAVGQLELAISVAKRLGGIEMRVAMHSLASTALDNDSIEFARQHGDMGELGLEMAAFYARRSEPGKALAEISKLGPGTLYVSPRQSAALTIINEAIDRRAVEQAMFYCKALCSSLVLDEIKVRTRIGRLQVQIGQRDSAKANFMRAKELIRLGDPYVGASDVFATLDLARAAEVSGLHSLATEIGLAAVQQAAYVSLSRRRAERPLAEAHVSQLLCELGVRAKATEMLELAWSDTREITDGYLGWEAQKAKALVAISEAARALARKFAN